MQNTLDIFTSLARVRVLRALSFQPQAVPLRHIAGMSGLPVFSVQNAIGSLVSDGIIVRREEDNNVLFELNKANTLYSLIMQFFVLEAVTRIREEAKGYSDNARHALEFAEAVNALFSNAKKKVRR